ncbi:heparinase II/III family protein [Alcaligenes faecalis]|uniref:heparinase II/III domain-containing protein n=1 Tax=Bacteria TaxID=2 RepID=UPI0024BC42F5|nr:heparinase II/III family protein [Alcaligenes faecalis]WHQ42632.1 hypothetical protein E8D21_02895 [Alcaligenes faecalis]
MSFVRDVELFEEQGFSPIQRPDLDFYKMELPFDWGVNPYKDSNWCFQLHTLRYLMVYLSAYRESRDSKYLLKLIDWFQDWWSWAKKNNAEFLWHDMATGIRSEKLYQLAKELSDQGMRLPDWMREMILQHVKTLREPGFIRLNHNHGLYAIHGLRCLAEILGPGMKANVVSLCYENFGKIIKNQFDDNYVHKEHSPHYHHLVLDSLKRYKKTKLYDGMPELDQYIEGAECVAVNLCLPDGREIPFGDTDYENPRELKECIDSKINLWSKSGYVVVKEGLSYLCVINNFNSGIHKHWDNLSLIYGVNGTDILVDPGKYKYTSDDLREFVVSSAAHNTINIEGLSWGAKELVRRSLFISGQKIETGVFVEGGMAIRCNNDLISFERQVEYKKNQLIIKDKVLGRNEGKAYSRFNFHKDFCLQSHTDEKIILSKDGFLVEVLLDGGDLLLKEPKYALEWVPVSYKYGSCEQSISLKVYNPGLLETKFNVLS